MKAGKADGEAWLRLSETTRLLGVSPNTLRRWSDAGRLACYRSPGGHRRYRRADIEALLHTQSSAHTALDERHSAGPSPDTGAADPLAAVFPALDALTRAAAEGIGVTSCLIAVDSDGTSQVVASYDSTTDHGVPAPGARLTRESAPAADEVRNTGRRMIVADVATGNVLTPNEVSGCHMRGEKAVLALPLTVSGRLFGVMQLVEHRTPRRFSGANVAFAEFVARQAAGIIADVVTGDAAPTRDRAPLPEGDDTSPGAEAATVSGHAWEGDSTLARRLAKLDGHITRAPSCASECDVLDGLQAFAQLVHGVSNDVSVTVFALSGGLARELAPVEGGSAAAIPIADDPDLAAAIAEGQPRLTTRDAVTVCLLPLCAGASTVGVAELRGASSQTLLRAAQILDPAARLLGATLSARATAGALERRADDLETVVEAGIEDISSLSTDEVLLSIIKRFSELTRSPVVDVYAVEGGTLRALIGYDAGRVDPEWNGVVIPIARYPCSRRAIETGETVVAASLDDEILGEDGRFSLERWGYQSQLSMPLIAGGRVIGLIELSDYTPRDFAEDLELIHDLGRVAARALENARLFEQAARRSRVLNELVEIGAFASSCRDFDTVFRHVAERLLRTLDAAACDVYRVSDGGLRCVASFDRSGFDEAAVGKLLDVATYPTVARAVSTGEVLVITGPDDPQLNERERQVYREFGFNSEVCVPLIVNDAPFGLIDVYDTRRRQYSEYLTFLRSLGASLAGAFTSALLLQQLEHRTAVLREVVELGELAAQGGELPELLAAIAERVRATAGVADCDVYALTGDKLHCIVSVDERGLDEEATGRTFGVSRFTVSELAVHTREAMVVASLDDPRVRDEEREDYAEWGFQSFVTIPLCSGDDVLGVLDVFDTRPRDYGEHLDFFRSAGQIIAGAMRHARLVSQLTARS